MRVTLRSGALIAPRLPMIARHLLWNHFLDLKVALIGNKNI